MARRSTRAITPATDACPYRMNLETMPHGIGEPRAVCVRDMEHASELAKRVENRGMTYASSGYDLGDPRAHEPPFPPGAKRILAIVESATGQWIAQASPGGFVHRVIDGRVDMNNPAYAPPPPPPLPNPNAGEWVGWFNKAGAWEGRRGREKYVHHDPTTPPPPLTPAERAEVASIFGLDKCRRIDRLLAATPNR